MKDIAGNRDRPGDFGQRGAMAGGTSGGSGGRARGRGDVGSVCAGVFGEVVARDLRGERCAAGAVGL